MTQGARGASSEPLTAHPFPIGEVQGQCHPAHTRQYGHGAVWHGYPRAEVVQHARRSAHCVVSLDNLSCTTVPVVLVTPQACLAEGSRGALRMGVLTSGELHPLMRVFGMRIGEEILPEDSRTLERERV